jgi:NADP-reducing hydrogenase subunit HndD
MAITIKINGKKIQCQPGDKVLEIAKANGIFIPSLCYHPDFKVKGNCRVCLVDVKGMKNPQTSCSLLAQEAMEINTDTALVKKLRNLNIEMIFAEHIEKCADCTLRFNCPLLDLVKRYRLKTNRFGERKASRKTYKIGGAVEIDGSQCIDCRNCVEACGAMQKINYLELNGKGINQEIVPTDSKDIACIYCGQCTLHCPVAAAQEQDSSKNVEKLLKDKNIITIAQFAPSVRVAIGEEFGMPYGEDSTGKTVAALKQLGFNYVFDVNFGADITTMVEAEELIERLNDKKAQLPMITSCCPAWVKYAEFYRPDLLPNLTTSRSPQIHIGGVIKSYFAKQQNIDPKKIRVVSVMPCTAKKFEAKREELKINGLWPVDEVITTREFAFMLKKNQIDFKKIKPQIGDKLLSFSSGAAAIYGSSGGVMESALRTATSLLCPTKKCQDRLDFKEVRGLKDIKEASFKMGNKTLKVAVVNGIGAFPQIDLKKYHYIEVMACPGGCIGGGGQPIPTTYEIRKQRVEALYRIDKFKEIRRAHENKEVLAVLEWIDKNKMTKQILHTKYIKRRSYGKKIS